MCLVPRRDIPVPSEECGNLEPRRRGGCGLGAGGRGCEARAAGCYFGSTSRGCWLCNADPLAEPTHRAGLCSRRARPIGCAGSPGDAAGGRGGAGMLEGAGPALPSGSAPPPRTATLPDFSEKRSPRGPMGVTDF